MLDKLRLLTVGAVDDPSRDELLTVLVELVNSRLITAIRQEAKRQNVEVILSVIPEELEWIVIELVVARFNRLGSEGMSSESVDGHAVTFGDSLLEEYESEVARYVRSFADESGGAGYRMVIW